MENLLLHVHEKLKLRFSSEIVAVQQEYDFPVYHVKRDKIVELMYFLRDDHELGFQFLTTMCGLHFPDQTGYELGIMYQLHNMPKNWRIRIKTFFPISDPTIQSLTSVFPTANWMERQEYDFFGIQFKGHPNLKRILNMDEMNYFPMRKEYPLEDATRKDKNDSMFGR